MGFPLPLHSTADVQFVCVFLDREVRVIVMDERENETQKERSACKRMIRQGKRPEDYRRTEISLIHPWIHMRNTVVRTVDFHYRSKDPNHSPLSVSQSKEVSKGEREGDERHSRVDFIDMQIECDRESFSFLASHPSFHSPFSLFQNHSNESLGLLHSISCRKKRGRRDREEEAMERKDEMKRAKDAAKIDLKKRLIRKLVLVCLVCHLFLFSSFCL